jgi:hypothetical protein
MKKLILAVAVVGLLAFAGVRMVAAHGGYGQGPGFGFCGQYYDSDNPKDDAAVKKFETETHDIRKSLAVKRNELRALLQQDNPDEKRVAKLTGEVFDLEADLDKKAAEAGLSGRASHGRGPGMMRGYGYRDGGRHMMDW